MTRCAERERHGPDQCDRTHVLVLEVVPVVTAQPIANSVPRQAARQGRRPSPMTRRQFGGRAEGPYRGVLLTAALLPGLTGRTSVESGRNPFGGLIALPGAGRGMNVESGCVGLI
jgi:hypothetical protein